MKYPAKEAESLVGEKPSGEGKATTKVEVRRYVKSDGWVTRYWAVYLNQDLLVVCLYKKGAEAVKQRLI
ncbi:MAG: hypothetical protein EOP84_09490 [Verrucomicrobiaceae bacterium]|nr:MAG: hypothetical protein EOP84_09490 [Verrucomicrobiaceae bacterium]